MKDYKILHIIRSKPAGFKKCLLGFSVSLLGLAMSITSLGTAAIAQETDSSSTSQSQFKVTFEPPSSDMPKTSMGGASRTIGQCLAPTQDTASFSPLLPVSNQGLTTQSHPTVLAYLPQTPAESAFFSWRGENNQELYQGVIPIDNQGGVIALSLPADAPPLEVGKNYQWALGIMCGDRLQPDSPMIHGQIKRVSPPIVQSQFEQPSLKNASLYGDRGLWYETVATLAQLKIAQPDNQEIADNWSQLLNSVGLEKIANMPLHISQPETE